MKRILMNSAVTLGFCLAFGGAVKADRAQNLQLGCVSVSCGSNGSIFTTETLTGAALNVTGNSGTSGEPFVAIFVPARVCLPFPERSSLVLLGVGLLRFVGWAGRKLITA